MKNHTNFEHKWSSDFYRNLRWKFLAKIKDNKRVNVLLKVIQRIYNESPEIHEVINLPIMEVCAEEEAYLLNRHFFILRFLWCCLIIMTVTKNQKKSVKDINIEILGAAKKKN